ncbi:iron chelate uptake ABC transporter family permease subunit [Dehalogenimonas sp. THU2]|uniref:FecCD family ABC transporter permease n=1 Tax=Dehalogenimonas sp. THU2 TaxID=3151121 RepID=UPI0032187D15
MSVSDIQARAAAISKTWKSRTIAIGILFIVLVLVGVFAITLGSVQIPFGTTFEILFSKLPFITSDPDWSPAFETIITNIRLPRVMLAGIVGLALAVAGASYQGLFRNPLADPYLIGVAQGAALGAVLGFLFPVAFLGGTIIPIFAFIGALVSVGVVYMLARVGGMIPVTTLILAGVAMGSLFSAMVSYLITISGDKIHGIIFWMMGSFSSSQWSEVRITWPLILVGVAIIFLFARALNIMQLGEEQAKQLGVDVEKVKIILLAVSTLITAAAVSFVGIIGFVGIIVPHAVRLIWGPDHRFLLPLSALVGAIFMILADIVARTLLAPTEIPIGIITAICGAPFFLYLLRKRTKVLF